MKKTFENKKNVIAIACAIALVVVATVVVAFTIRQDDAEIKEPDTTLETQVAEASSTEPTDEVEQVTEEDASTEAVKEVEPELTGEAEETATVKPKEEVETRKEPATKKPTPVKNKETTTKAVETTTKKTSSMSVTYDGHKPYEVFVSETGTKVYYDEYGIRYVAESLTAKPITPEYDADCCYKCGSDACLRTMNGYYCVICEKDIPASTCHPKSHYNASK